MKNHSGEPSPRPFSKKSKLSISLDQQGEILYSLLLLYVQVEDYLNILKLGYCQLASTLFKAFTLFELVFLLHFRHDF